MNDFLTTLALKVYDPRLTKPEENEQVLCIYAIGDEFSSNVCRYSNGSYYAYDECAAKWVWQGRPDLWVKLPDEKAVRDLCLKE